MSAPVLVLPAPTVSPETNFSIIVADAIGTRETAAITNYSTLYNQGKLVTQ